MSAAVKPNPVGAFLLMLLVIHTNFASAAQPIYSTRLIHRFSHEAQTVLGSATTETMSWPQRKSLAHVRALLGNDLRRQKLRLKLGAQNQTLVASTGGQTFSYGNEMGWLHYAWIDIGMPNNSFLVALDTGSDMFWVPCDCITCAPLSLSYYSMLDKELGQYSPSHSSSSKQVPCSHELCEMGPKCNSPEGHCPYTVDYYSGGTSSSGYLFEDLLHLALVGGSKQNSSVPATIIMGCGSKQTGAYLSGIAPDGVMGLGPGDLSVPSLLAKSGFAPHSFSFCYDKSYSGRLYFGDQGTTSQQSTPLVLPKERTYIVEVETYCIGSTCLKQVGSRVQVDTGSSFTALPHDSYDRVTSEFHRQVNATRTTEQEFDYCYKASSLKGVDIPSIKLVFSMNQSLSIEDPTFIIAGDDYDNEEDEHRCLGIQLMKEGDIGVIGQNFMMGYRMVFDWENLKLGWSASNCDDTGDGGEAHSTPPLNDDSQDPPLPTAEQQQNHHGRAVAPAVAGVTPNHSAGSCLIIHYQNCLVILLLLLWIANI